MSPWSSFPSSGNRTFLQQGAASPQLIDVWSQDWVCVKLGQSWYFFTFGSGDNRHVTQFRTSRTHLLPPSPSRIHMFELGERASHSRDDTSLHLSVIIPPPTSKRRDAFCSEENAGRGRNRGKQRREREKGFTNMTSLELMKTLPCFTLDCQVTPANTFPLP